MLVCSTRYWLTADPGMNLRRIWSENGGAYGGPSDAYLFLRPTLAIIHTSAICVHTLTKKKIKFSLNIRKLRVEQLQSHI